MVMCNTYTLGQSVTMQNTYIIIVLSILHNKYMYLCMKYNIFNCMLYDILFVMIPYDLIGYRTPNETVLICLNMFQPVYD